MIFDLQRWHNKTRQKTRTMFEVTSLKLGKIKWGNPFHITFLFFIFFHLTVLGISFYLDFMGVI